MSQHYYVIYFDDETKEWVHDPDSEQIRFIEGTIWNEDKSRWQRIDRLEDDENNSHMVSYEILNDGLTWLNRISAVWHLNKDNK